MFLAWLGEVAAKYPKPVTGCEELWKYVDLQTPPQGGKEEDVEAAAKVALARIADAVIQFKIEDLGTEGLKKLFFKAESAELDAAVTALLVHEGATLRRGAPPANGLEKAAAALLTKVQKR